MEDEAKATYEAKEKAEEEEASQGNKVEVEKARKVVEMEGEDAKKEAPMDTDDKLTSEKEPTGKSMAQRLAKIKERK